jgi:hypothetical protein
MKVWKPFIWGCFLLLMLSLTIGKGYAAPIDMSQWIGKWFNIKVKQNGTTFSNTGLKFFKDSGSGSVFLKIWNWDANNQKLQFDICYRNGEKWMVDADQNFVFLAGTDVKFLLWFESSGEGPPSTAFAAVMEGKDNKIGILQGANIKTLGGFYTDSGNEGTQFSAGTFTLTGKMIDMSKVPAECTALIQH